MTEVDWLIAGRPYDLAKFCRGRVEPQRFRWLAAEWGGRIRHIFLEHDLRYFDAFTAWVAGTGEHPDQVCPDPQFDPFVHWVSRVEDAINCVKRLRLNDPMTASAYAAESLADYLPPLKTEPVDFNKTHRGRAARKKAAAKAKQEEVWKRGSAAKAAHQERTHYEFCEQFRCVAGNPFRPVVFEPAWRTETGVALARGIFDDRQFANLPILADALEEAGCHQPDILAHCRGPGPHVRGCWVVDLVLAR